MGQSASGISVQCAGRDLGKQLTVLGGAFSSGGPQYEQLNLLEDTWRHCSEKTVVDRADLVKRHPFERFKRLENELVTLRLAISPEGDAVELKDRISEFEAVRQEHTLLELKLPGITGHDPDSFVRVRGGGQVFTVRVYSDECPYLPAQVRRCESSEAIQKLLLDVLACGAQTLNLTICHQMLELEFDKIDVLQETPEGQEDRGGAWVITSYLWVVMKHYRLYPKRDSLQTYFDQVKRKPATRQHIINTMRRDGMPEHKLELFIEGTGGRQGYGPKTDRYLRMMAQQAKDREFGKMDIVEFVNAATNPNGLSYVKEIKDDEEEVVYGTIAENVHHIINEIKRASVDHSEWKLIVGWEPLQVKHVEESLHEAQRCKVASDEMGYARNALRAVEIAIKKAKKEEERQADQVSLRQQHQSNALQDGAVDSILAANQSMLEKIVEAFERGKTSRDRFEEQFIEACDGMIGFIDKALLPQARQSAKQDRLVMCLRTKADYLRYLHVWIPSRRTSEHIASHLYEEAMSVATSLPPCHLTQLTSCVNYAIFQGEVLRRYDLAAAVCRDGYCKIKERLPVEMSASQTFNWFLISHNLAAFESYVVVLVVKFNKDILKLHEAVEPRAIDAAPALVAHSTPRQSSKAAGGVPPGTPQAAQGSPRGSPQRSPTARPGFETGFACLGARERLCIERIRGGPAESAVPAKVEPDPSVAARAAVHPWKRAVQRWLRSRPLFHWEMLEWKDEKANDKDKDKDKDTDSATDGHGHHGEMDAESLPKGVAQVRWVEHTEHIILPAGADHNESSESEGEEGHAASPSAGHKEDETEVCMKKVRKTMRDKRDGAEGELHSFVLSCSIRLKPGSLEGNKLQSNPLELEWLRNFKSDLEGLAPGNQGRKQVRVQKLDELAELLRSMDLGAGLLQKPVQVGEDLLLPGDTLLMEGQLAGRDVRSVVKAWREGSMQVPINLIFLQGLQVEHAEVLAMAPYSEVHHHFTGFREIGNLKMNSKKASHSLVSVAGELLAHTDSSRGGKVAPRRLRDLSARRNPTKAGTRGCK